MSDPFHSARQMYREGRYRDAALAAFSGMNEEPGNARGVRLAAMCMMQSGLWEAAKPVLRRAMDLEPVAAVLNDMGRCEQNTGRHAPALRCFRQAAVMEPDDVAATCNAALIHLNEGDFETAERWSRRAAAIKPSEPAVWDNIALSRLAQGDQANGWKLYERSIGIERREERIYGAEMRWRGPEIDRATRDMGGIPTRSLMVYGEQGIGDEILHSACVPDVL